MDKFDLIEKERRKYIRKEIFNIVFSILTMCCGILFIILGIVIAQGKFLALFLILGLFVLLFLPVIFVFQAKSQKKKYVSYVFSLYLLDFTSSYETFSFVYHSKDDKHIDPIIPSNSKIIPSSYESFKGNINKTFFVSYLFELNKSISRVFSYTTHYFVPHSILIVSKKNVTLNDKENKEYFAFENSEHKIYLEDKNIDISSLLNEIQENEKKYSCSISIYIKDNKWIIYFDELKKEDMFSLHFSFKEEYISKIKEKYLLGYEVYQSFKIEE